MFVNTIHLYHVRMPLVEPWRTAYGEDAAIESILVRMTSGSYEAWAETSPLAAPCYSPEFAAGAFAVLRDWLAPAIVGQEIEFGAALQQRLSHFKGNPFAKAALDNAWWVLEAVRREMPLHRLLGATRNQIPVGADFGVTDSNDELVEKIATAVEQGFPRIKLKFRPGWDIPMLAAVRREFPATTIHIDCNSGYTLDDVDLFRRIDEFGLAMIEQPLAHDDVVDHAKLQAQLRTPICLDETITSLARARQAIELGSCRYVNIKPGRVGGLTNALAIHALCRDAGIPCWVGGMLESAVGARVCVALAMLDNFTYPADIFPSRRFYHDDLARPEVELIRDANGVPCVVAPNIPGTGATPQLDRLRECTVAEAVIDERSASR
jgi:o-succinylbenzoate synthase